jgi:hypothetical protein
MPQLTQTLLLRGGLNIVTPAIAVPSGQIIAGVNYEPEVRGYRRIGGYERYDGRPRPSDASYWILGFTAGSVEVAVGNIVTGGTSGATGKALFVGTRESGSYAGSDAAGYLILTLVSGTFVNGEDLEVSASKVAEADGTARERDAESDTDGLTRLVAARSAARALITAVPGSGPVRGIMALGGALYAIRDNAGATAGVLHKATASGWTAQALGHTVTFSATTGAEVFEGETLTQGGVTSTIHRVVRTSGAWGVDAAGYIVVTNIAGGNYAAGSASTPSGTVTLTGAQVENTLPAGGRYDSLVRNFFGAGKTPRIYASNGIGRAFEYDGTALVFIRTGLSDALDKPTFIAEFSNHLFLSIPGGEVQFSGVGRPLDFTALSGAGAFSVGSDVTGFLPSASSALIVFGRSKVGYLAGTDVENFQFQALAEDAGAIEWTAAQVGTPMYQDDAGVRRMTTTQAFGNWRMGAVTQLVEPIFESNRRRGISSVASVRVRAKDQYKLFFSDGTGLTIYVGRKDPEIVPFKLAHQAACTGTGLIDANVDYEGVFFGGEDGFVYEMNRGTSFDGEEVVAFAALAFNNVGLPAQRKRWHKATLEIDAEPGTRIGLTAEFAYGGPEQPPSPEESFTVTGGGGFWNRANWDEFFWSSPVQGIAEAYIGGLGRNISITVLSDATHEEPHTLSSMTLNFTYRSLVR